jgi:hypothetical protein
MVIGQSDSGTVLQHRVMANRLTPGEVGSVTLGFSVKEGFKIAKRPAPMLQLTTSSDFEVKSPVLFQEARAGKDPEYYGDLKPLEISVLTGKDIPPGQYGLEGKLAYVYCSEKDKYCGRSVAAIKIPIIVVKK